jgi:hypothetical protein
MPPLPVGSLQVAEVTLCTSLKISGLTPYYQIKKDPEARRMLNADLLSRISYLIGIFKALNTSMLGRLPTSGCAFQIPTASLAALVLWTI